ncbi:MAG: hypothetical protein HRF50_09975 [Phycisphaerae bacterium]
MKSLRVSGRSPAVLEVLRPPASVLSVTQVVDALARDTIVGLGGPTLRGSREV